MTHVIRDTAILTVLTMSTGQEFDVDQSIQIFISRTVLNFFHHW